MTIHTSSGEKKRVLIAHPARQHSHQAALSLLEAGLLGCYATGIPVRDEQLGKLSGRLVRALSVYEPVEIPTELIRLNMAAPIVNRVFARYLPERLTQPIQYETYRSFDRWVANLIARQRFDAVVAYENSALQTFRQAKRRGIACILDAASLHRAEADRRLEVRMPRAYKRGVDRRKDMEVTLADCIFVTSDLAAQTYRSNIAQQTRIETILLGADIDRFTPVSPSVIMEPFTFIFVGAGTERKGFDFLLNAIAELRKEDYSFKVAVAGVIDRTLLAGRQELMPIIDQCGMIGHDKLIKVLRGAQCLVLPSRFDAFGMVVPEAMACGLPVIVSDMVGAKQIVEEGRNGFVVPTGDVDALVDRMRWFLRNKGNLENMSVAARATAECVSWVNYRRRFAMAIREVMLDR